MPGVDIRPIVSELSDVELTIHPETLNVYRWWRPDMTLPAVYNWLTPATTEPPDRPACRVVDLARITVCIAVDPTAVAGEGDMLEVEEYLLLATAAIDPLVYADEPFGQRIRARRQGFQTVNDELGGVPILVLELPLEVYVESDLDPVP